MFVHEAGDGGPDPVHVERSADNTRGGHQDAVGGEIQFFGQQTGCFTGTVQTRGTGARVGVTGIGDDGPDFS